MKSSLFRIRFHRILPAIVFFILLGIPAGLYARAGGGGSDDGPADPLTLAVCLVYAIVLWFLIGRREEQADGALRQLAFMEKSWGRKYIHDRICQVYYKVQEAWAARDQSQARDCMSERLFNLHQEKTDAMLARHERNVLEQITLQRIQIVEVADFADDSLDRMWVVIHGSMIDYVVDERSGEILRGDKNERAAFKELWKFIRGPEGWVLDEIDPEVELSDLTRFRSFIQGP